MQQYQFRATFKAYLEITGIKEKVLINMKAQRKRSGVYRNLSEVSHWASTPEGVYFWHQHHTDFLYFRCRINNV